MPSARLFNTCEDCAAVRLKKLVRSYRKAGYTVIEVYERKMQLRGVMPRKRCHHQSSYLAEAPTVISITARRP